MPIRLRMTWFYVVMLCFCLAPTLMAQGRSATWATQANQLNGQVGQRFTLTFPGGGHLAGRLWGTDLYTNDSSIALAAVHAGLISAAQGGTATIELRPGAASYRGSTRHGVASKDYGTWQGSFVFVAKPSAPPTVKVPAPPVQVVPPVVQPISSNNTSWDLQAKQLKGQDGQRFTLTFAGGGRLTGRLWGTDLYTNDSSIALAAVHAGQISAIHGGTATIEVRPGATSYRGSTRHGVESQNYGGWEGSFIFVSKASAPPPAQVLPPKPPTPVVPPVVKATAASWATQATQANQLGGQFGQR